MDDRIDIKENYVYQLNKSLLAILLKDRSSKKNIIWATDSYLKRGNGYFPLDNITVKAITGRNGVVIKPRVEKSKREQSVRIKQKAEVFTPSWICNAQNNLVDNAWFGRENVFNCEKDKTWLSIKEKIIFPTGKSWQDYVKENRLEISCGEAPYLVSRYDTVTGKWLDVNERIGLLDRKLRVINENVESEDDWVKWAMIAFKSIYGFEWQGDSLLIARENLLFTFIDYYVEKFGNYPIDEHLKEFAKVISWNIWQMDGVKFVIPNSYSSIPKIHDSLIDNDEKEKSCQDCSKNSNKLTDIYCKVKNWETNRSIKFISLLKNKS